MTEYNYELLDRMRKPELSKTYLYNVAREMREREKDLCQLLNCKPTELKHKITMLLTIAENFQ